jgi:hypothetical protein
MVPKMTNLPSVGLVISALGGNSRVAELTHSNPKAVSNWKVSNRFPAATYVTLRERLKTMGLSAPDKLWGMRLKAKKRRKRRRA